jgi:hypothetical protein
MRRVFSWALIACLAAGVVGCRGRQPVFLDRDDVQTSYKLDHVELLGPVEGMSTRRRLLFLSFGPPKSFLQAEQEALKTVDGEILLDRVRYTGKKGVIVPIGSLIRVFFEGFPDVDMPIWVTEIWYVEGIAAKYKGPERGGAGAGR